MKAHKHKAPIGGCHVHTSCCSHWSANGDSRCFSPPDGITDKHNVILLHVLNGAGDCRAGIGIIHFNRSAAVAIIVVKVGIGVGICGNDLIEVSTQTMCNMFCGTLCCIGRGEICHQDFGPLCFRRFRFLRLCFESIRAVGVFCTVSFSRCIIACTAFSPNRSTFVSLNSIGTPFSDFINQIVNFI